MKPVTMMWRIYCLVILMVMGITLTCHALEEKQLSDQKTGIVTPDLGDSAPVVVWNRTIAVLRSDQAESPPAERASRAIQRIEALPAREDYKIITAEVKVQGKEGILIGLPTEALFILLPGDLDPVKKETLDTVAKAAAVKLKAVLDEHAMQLQWSNLAWSLGFATAATLFYILVLWPIFPINRRITKVLEKSISQWSHTILVAGIDLIPAMRLIIRGILKTTTLAVILTVTYLWLAFCLSRFFYTQPWADRLGEFLMDFIIGIALGVLDAAPGLLMVIVIIWITRITASGISRFFTGVEKGTVSVSWLEPDSARASRRIMIAVIWIFALTIAYPYIPGSGSNAFKGVSVFAGLMFSLGSTGFINHLMSGLVITYSGSMHVGDYISINDIEGVVRELGPMSTKIVTLKNELLNIPNGVVTSTHVTNYTRLSGKDGAIVSTSVTIGYDAPWRQVHALLIQAAEKIALIRNSPAPFMLQRALSDFYVVYELRFYLNLPSQKLSALSALHAAIQDGFNEAGVQIMSPNFVSQPEKPVLVPKSQWDQTPVADPAKQNG